MEKKMNAGRIVGGVVLGLVALSSISGFVRSTQLASAPAVVNTKTGAVTIQDAAAVALEDWQSVPAPEQARLCTYWMTDPGTTFSTIYAIVDEDLSGQQLTDVMDAYVSLLTRECPTATDV
jgi:hypothetical protein